MEYPDFVETLNISGRGEYAEHITGSSEILELPYKDGGAPSFNSKNIDDFLKQFKTKHGRKKHHRGGADDDDESADNIVIESDDSADELSDTGITSKSTPVGGGADMVDDDESVDSDDMLYDAGIMSVDGGAESADSEDVLSDAGIESVEDATDAEYASLTMIGGAETFDGVNEILRKYSDFIE